MKMNQEKEKSFDKEKQHLSSEKKRNVKYDSKQEVSSDKSKTQEMKIGDVEKKLEQWKDLYNGTQKSDSQ